MTACISNMKNMAPALDMYAVDNQGQLPDALRDLTPDYLKSLQTCRGAIGDAERYRRAQQNPNHLYGYYLNQETNIFTLYCKVGYHIRATCPENYPQYNSRSKRKLFYRPDEY